MTFPTTHAKPQRREEIRASKIPLLSVARRLGVVFFLWSFSVVVNAQTNSLSAAEIKGRELARQLCEARPEQNFHNSGVLKIRDGKGKLVEERIQFETIVTSTNWLNVYRAGLEDLTVVHLGNRDTEYRYHAPNGKVANLSGNQAFIPFAGSDFWLCDLGLEFFHWPGQRILPKTPNMPSLKLGREYTLLESSNFNPPTNGYAKVITWLDKETGGILQAKAYDPQGKLLKVFEPKSVEKIKGQWQLQEIGIRNDQRGSSTRLEFDLKPAGE